MRGAYQRVCKNYPDHPRNYELQAHERAPTQKKCAAKTWIAAAITRRKNKGK
jgi:hypothetical protein